MVIGAAAGKLVLALYMIDTISAFGMQSVPQPITSDSSSHALKPGSNLASETLNPAGKVTEILLFGIIPDKLVKFIDAGCPCDRRGQIDC